MMSILEKKVLGGKIGNYLATMIAFGAFFWAGYEFRKRTEVVPSVKQTQEIFYLHTIQDINEDGIDDHKLYAKDQVYFLLSLPENRQYDFTSGVSTSGKTFLLTNKGDINCDGIDDYYLSSNNGHTYLLLSSEEGKTYDFTNHLL